MSEDEGKNDEQAGDDAAPPEKKKRAKRAKANGADAGDESPKRPRRAKQTQIPGTERHEKIPELELAAAEYVEVRDERMGWTKKEVAKREIVRDLMKKNGLLLYECDGEDLTVELLPAKEEKVRVKRRDVEDDDAEDEAG